MGRGIHTVRARLRARIGARMNIETEDVAGHSGSLMKSLIHQQWLGVGRMGLQHLGLFGIAYTLELSAPLA